MKTTTPTRPCTAPTLASASTSPPAPAPDQAAGGLVPLQPGPRPVLRSPEAPSPKLDSDALAHLGAASLAARPASTASLVSAVGRQPGRARRGELPESVGATALADRAAFERLARRDDAPGALQAREVKFLIVGADTASPTLYLINTRNFDYHFDFATQGLGMTDSLESFNAKTYFSDRRQNIAGSLILHDNFEGESGTTPLFTFEFWPTDQVKAPHVKKTYDALARAMPWAVGQLKYHPAGSTQEALFHREAAELERLAIPVIESKALFAHVTYAPMNMGEGYGTLRVIDGARAGERPPSIRDVVLFKSTPNDLSHVGGIITENPQTPLSHINLKAKQNSTPNAYVKNATQDPRIVPFLRDPPPVVYYRVGPDGFELREASEEEASRWLEGVRPAAEQHPERDLTITEARPLEEIAFGDAHAFGAKATNVAELRRIFSGDTVPAGFAVPFHFYDRFMEANGFYADVEQLRADPTFTSDAGVREARLKALRGRIKAAPMPAELATELSALEARMRRSVGPEAGLRCRSSTNNEDLPRFNGAGLYDSYTHRPGEGELSKTIKQVYASMWNFRAFEEREFYRIAHGDAAMGVLVHKNEDGEQANGVAYTKNIYDENWPGFYVNAQLGEDLVTNPTAGATPDEFLVSRIGPNGEDETQYISHSSQVEEGQTVLSPERVEELVAALERIHAHFKPLYGREGDATFAMDVEFKIRANGALQIKQARPVVD